MPNTYSNGFYKNNKRLSSPMISGGQKFGSGQKFKFNSYKIPSPGHSNVFNFKKKDWELISQSFFIIKCKFINFSVYFN